VLKKAAAMNFLVLDRLVRRSTHRTFKKLYAEKKYAEAVPYGEALVKQNPLDHVIRRKLAACYGESGDTEKAVDLKWHGFSKKETAAIRRNIPVIERKLGSHVTTRMLYTDGMKNLCILLHEAEGRTFLTKVINTTENKRELVFYKRMYPASAGLRNVSPRLFSLIEDSGTAFITQEKAEGKLLSKDCTEENVDNALGALEEAVSLEEKKLKPLVPKRTLMEKGEKLFLIYMIQNLPLHMFDKIDKKRKNTRIFRRVHRELERKNFSQETKNLYSELETLVMDRPLYKKLRPHHFTLIHGDFHGDNIFIDRGDYTVIDWASFRRAPRVIDAVKLLGRSGFSFEKITRVYLDHPAHGKTLDPEEKQLFLYALAVFWLDQLPKETLESHVRPLIDRLRKETV
jgi:thiamine kinase-like enzyme